uniref:Putative ovule protein n=1 Tax=Solanum chacoense TaxID=4108 RepID=A0A0V0HJH9_SOLCH
MKTSVLVLSPLDPSLKLFSGKMMTDLVNPFTANIEMNLPYLLNFRAKYRKVEISLHFLVLRLSPLFLMPHEAFCRVITELPCLKSSFSCKP